MLVSSSVIVHQHIEETRLDNGIVVLSDRMPGVRSVTLGFFFRAGSRNEPVDLNGISHFIEHTVFKGTERRTALDIAIEQERLGGNFDAFTTHEETGFAIKVIDERLDEAFDLIADILTAPRFHEKDLESEQRVIIEEMKMIDDSPEEYLGEVFSNAFFPRHALGMSIAGTPATVRSFDARVTAGYHSAVFHPSNLVIAAAGNVRHEHLADLCGRHFGADPVGPVTPDEAPSPEAPIVIKRKRDLEQAHLILATPLVGGSDPRRYAADLLAGIVGGGTASRLWQKVREERGLAYSVGSSAIMYRDCGLFSVYAGTSPKNVGEVIDLAVAEMRAVAREGATPGELEIAKQQATASVLLSLEDSASRAAALAQCEIVHGRQISVDETLEQIAAVTPDDIRELAREFFVSERVAFAAVGDVPRNTIDRDRLAVT